MTRPTATKASATSWLTNTLLDVNGKKLQLSLFQLVVMLIRALLYSFGQLLDPSKYCVYCRQRLYNRTAHPWAQLVNKVGIQIARMAKSQILR